MPAPRGDLLLPGVPLASLALLGSVPLASKPGLLLSLVNERQHSIQHPPSTYLQA